MIPNLIRGGFVFGGRRGRGVLAIRSPNGEWSNPAFVTLTGGSFGAQFGAESADVVLVFANDRAVRNIASGKFTLGGDATAIAGPLGRRTQTAVTGRAEVYVYMHSRGLFAGAAFEGTRLDVDQEASAAFYRNTSGVPLGAQTVETPAAALPFLDALRTAAVLPGAPSSSRRTAATGRAERRGSGDFSSGVRPRDRGVIAERRRRCGTAAARSRGRSSSSSRRSYHERRSTAALPPRSRAAAAEGSVRRRRRRTTSISTSTA